jgi:acid phosphatase family membrane protein YuiD
MAFLKLLEQIIYNYIFIAAAVAWLISQIVKIIWFSVKNRGFRRQFLVSSGGFPSSHTATVIGMTAMAARIYGFDSPVFAVAFFSAIIVIYDALGVRREAGKHAAILNRLMDEHPELFGGEPLQPAADLPETDVPPAPDLNSTSPEDLAEYGDLTADASRLTRTQRAEFEERREHDADEKAKERKSGSHISYGHLEENIGHTFGEVVVGFIIGVAVAVFMPIW